MRPVNLLPQQYRSAGPSGGRSGSSYVLLGALGAVFLGVLLYVFTANQVTSREADAAEARGEAEAAEARVATLAPFGAFHQVQQTRSAAVRTLAEGRLDWERLARELAHVLPRGVRLESLEGSTGEGAASEGITATSTSAGSSDADEATGPSLILAGCARSQPAVATTLVRLRRLNGAEDVTLEDSTSATATSTANADGGGGGSVADCPAYSFNATVHLAPVEAPIAGGQAKAQSVPARLGGGQ